MNLPTSYPRRVTTGPLRHVGAAGRKSLRGTTYNYRQTTGQASYMMYAAHEKATPRHERWLAANAFFQEADYERHLIGRNASAILANDWSSFGYMNYSMEEYLQLEVAAMKAR